MLLNFTDNNFFVSEGLVAESSLNWWSGEYAVVGKGRIDTIDQYSDSSVNFDEESRMPHDFLVRKR